MSSTTAPLLVALAAAGLLLFLVVIVPMARRPLERMRMKGRVSPAGEPVTEEWVYRSRAPVEVQIEPAGPIVEMEPAVAIVEADVGVGERSDDTQDTPVPLEDSPVQHEAAEQEPSEPRVAEEAHETRPVEKKPESLRIIEDAHRRARDLLEDAELEAKRIVVAAGERARHESELEREHAALGERWAPHVSLATVQEAERKAEEMLLAAEQHCATLARESEAEAQRAATEIIADARRQAAEHVTEAEREAKAIAERRREELHRETEAEAERNATHITNRARRQAKELLENAEIEAAQIVATASRERARLVEELEHERSVFEQTQTRLSGFLADMLEEVRRTPATHEGPANVRDLDEARAVRRV